MSSVHMYLVDIDNGMQDYNYLYPVLYPNKLCIQVPGG